MTSLRVCPLLVSVLFLEREALCVLCESGTSLLLGTILVVGWIHREPIVRMFKVAGPWWG